MARWPTKAAWGTRGAAAARECFHGPDLLRASMREPDASSFWPLSRVSRCLCWAPPIRAGVLTTGGGSAIPETSPKCQGRRICTRWLQQQVGRERTGSHILHETTTGDGVLAIPAMDLVLNEPVALG